MPRVFAHNAYVCKTCQRRQVINLIIMATFANILYDDAFKVVLTEPSNNRLLIKLVEFFLPGKTIQSLSLDDKEQHGLILSDKNCTFDLFCTTNNGERIIVEMQFLAQSSFRERMLYYATYPIRSQIMERMKSLPQESAQGRMNYALNPVYVISILNFKMPHEDENTLEEGMISRYDLRSPRTGEMMTDALHFVYLELGRLRWKENEQDKCRTLLEKLAFSLKYGHLQNQRPTNFKGELLQLLYDATAFANMDERQLLNYNKVMRTELDILAWKEYARQEGLEEGRAEGREAGLAEGREAGLAEGKAEGKAEMQRELVLRMKAKGMDEQTVAELVGLSPEDVRGIV